MPPRKLTLDDLNREFNDKPVSFTARGGRISLVATLPTRDGVTRRQQRVSLGLGLTQIELEEARNRGYDLFTQITRGLFSWDKWDRSKVSAEYETTAALLERFKVERRAQGIPEHTLYIHWLVYKKLPQDRPLTKQAIINVVRSYPVDGSARRVASNHLNLLAKFAGIDLDLKEHRGSYTSSRVKARDLPTDEEIEQIWESIPTLNSRSEDARSLQWVYGMMATYGLRNHEVMLCEVDSKHPYICRVFEGKTGGREVYPLPPEWVKKFNLLEVRRPQNIAVEGRTHIQIGAAVGRKLRRTSKKLDKYHKPYETRHAYALRGELRYNLGTRVMAEMMGHSEQNHINTYKRWLNKHSMRKAYLDRVMTPVDPAED